MSASEPATGRSLIVTIFSPHFADTRGNGGWIIHESSHDPELVT